MYVYFYLLLISSQNKFRSRIDKEDAGMDRTLEMASFGNTVSFSCNTNRYLVDIEGFGIQ